MWISDFPPPLFCCNGEAWLGIEGTTPFLGTHRDVPRENQIKPECLFPCVCVCRGGRLSLDLIVTKCGIPCCLLVF